MDCNGEIFVGDSPRIDVTFTNPASAPIPDALEDPASIVMRIVYSDLTTVSRTYSALSGVIKRESEGVYYCETEPMTVVGKTTIWFEAARTGGGNSSQRIEVNVKRK